MFRFMLLSGLLLHIPACTPENLQLDSGVIDEEGEDKIVTLLYITQVVVGGHHACALYNTGSVRCWGENTYGQLGNADTAHNIGDDELTKPLVNVGGKVIQLAAGSRHTCALLDTGNVRCWGSGQDGELGYGNLNNVSNPAAAGNVNIGGKVIQIAAGYGHTCAVLDTNNVRCWGRGWLGALGYGNSNNIGDNETPASAGDVPVGARVTQIATGELHTCVVTTSGNARCWGYNGNSPDDIGNIWGWGQLGYGHKNNIGDNETPASVGDVPVGGKVTQIAAGYRATCAIIEGGGLKCWGFGGTGGLGYGNTNSIGDDEFPSSVGLVPVGGKVVQVGVGDHACARLDTGAVRCWGYAHHGRLGYSNANNIGDNEFPSQAGSVNVGDTVHQISVGAISTCTLTNLSKVHCWGGGWTGALGYGNYNDIGDNETPASAGLVSFF